VKKWGVDKAKWISKQERKHASCIPEVISMTACMKVGEL
jgi:hypothetical protein